MNLKGRSLHFLLAGLMALDLTAAYGYSQGPHTIDRRRGNPSEYDPGPLKGSSWEKLFASGPNYRALGQFILGGSDEKFRWKMGPMWYRGRLPEQGKNGVKALVIGQEGAQDENISNRAFTGSTGTKTQKFLNFLGLNSSYIFLNTFTYTINGQLSHEDPKFKWMEQGWSPDGFTSPIVEYRHSLFDNAARQSPETFALVMGVGSGGKASALTWAQSYIGKQKCPRIGDCDPVALRDALTRKFKSENSRHPGMKNKILLIGVRHPGGASPRNGGASALKGIVRSFEGAAKDVAHFMKSNPGWMIPDRGMGSPSTLIRRLQSEYRYGDAPIPFRDFTYGTNWRMGARGTTSNRQGSDSIQVFSSSGKYNGGDDNPRYSSKPSDVNSGFIKSGRYPIGLIGMNLGGKNRPRGREPWNDGEPAFDLSYESPRYDGTDHSSQYDYGPCGFDSDGCKLSSLLQNWPDFYKMGTGPISHPSFGHGPTHRGNVQNAEVLVIADQHSHDDFFSGRALTGSTGQQLQTMLNMMGARGRYLILRTLPVDSLGDLNKLKGLALNSDVVAHRDRILTEVARNTKVVISLGPVADEVVKASRVLSRISRKAHLSSMDDKATVNSLIGKVASAIGSRKQAAWDRSTTYKGQLTTINREDLPSHTRWWMGSSGTRARRAQGRNGSNYYRFWSPRWSSYQKPYPLNKSMSRSSYTKLSKMVARLRSGRSGESLAAKELETSKGEAVSVLATESLESLSSLLEEKKIALTDLVTDTAESLDEEVLESLLAGINYGITITETESLLGADNSELVAKLDQEAAEANTIENVEESLKEKDERPNIDESEKSSIDFPSDDKK